ncbi:MAG: divergent polysaccharide deacetylase family protein [Alphaproteobacteria bacterium]|nr:divergent polysaccharide deacetylase family protein [Alphaproteobacteria bacterium]
MRFPQLTRTQLRLLILKGIHLLAVFVIVAVWLLYFGRPQEESLHEEQRLDIDKDLSAYEQFCQNNNDISCGSIENFIVEEQDAEVVLTDTDEMDEAMRMQISYIAENGSDINIHPEDMNKLLDHIYEEKLPDDIIDEATSVDKPTSEIKNTKMKNLHIIPSHKPPYFGKHPVIVIVIDDMGISLKRTADIASLKAPITVSFLTYGRNLDEQIQNSLKNGQEIMIHVPMEAKTAVDVAPDVLTTQMSNDEIKQNLLDMLQKFENVKGINNHMGSKLTEDYDRMKVVMEVLKSKGFYFLDSKTSPNSKAENAAADVGIAYAHRHVFLDNNNDKLYILGQLAKTEKLARKNGYAIAIGHPKTQTYAALKEWLPKIEKNGIKIIPLSKAIDILNPSYK